jgi:hypothetical protein
MSIWFVSGFPVYDCFPFFFGSTCIWSTVFHSSPFSFFLLHPCIINLSCDENISYVANNPRIGSFQFGDTSLGDEHVTIGV